MKVSVKQTFWAVLPPGRLNNTEDILICPTEEAAHKAQAEELDMTGINLKIVPVDVLIPMTLDHGHLTI